MRPRVAVREERLAAELAYVVADLRRPVRAQIGKVAWLTEMYLDCDELAVEVYALKTGLLHEAAQLGEQAPAVRAHIGIVDFCFSHV